MSPVFRHGRLRLYLLKLLDEAPRHGYEVIRLLQDRFLGVYSPSPGTIYPRLARLEEEGLVTHDEADGRKIYRITGKGRAELESRLDDLAELEAELTASVRDIAQEVSEDVRETVRSLREELTWAVRDIRGPHGPQARPQGTRGPAGPGDGPPRQQREREQGPRDRDREPDGERDAGDERDRDRERGREPGAERDLEGEHERGRRGEHAGWGQGRGFEGWGGWQGWSDWSEWWEWPHRHGSQGQHGRWGDPRAYRDMERMARRFSRELRSAAWQAQAIGEDAVASLRDILEDTLERIRTEVFQAGPGRQDEPRQRGD
ncbi:MAG: PadR family transcriptional regulator [Nocardiopsaceae bacterium]|nr:PadR family transcriptional regulator [Nocardiopsaceae bacterium]